jgi:hypothetical protein
VGEGIREEKLPNELYKRKEEPTFSWGGKTTIILKNDSVVNL